MTDDLRDLFHDNEPTEPATIGWADRVHRKRSQRRWMGGGVAVALLLAVGVPLGLQLARTPVTVATPAESNATSAAQACEQAEALTSDTSHRGAPVERGAKRAWLCGDATEAGPADPLTQDVDAAVEAYLALPEAAADRACTEEYRLTYTVVFQYEDGTVAPVRGELHGCRTVTDFDTTRSGGEEFLGTLADLWRKERETSDFNATSWPTQTSSILRPDLGNIDRVQFTWPRGDGKVEARQPDSAGTWGSNQAFAAAIADSLAEPATHSALPAVFSPGDEGVIVLADRFGDVISLQPLIEGGYLYTPPQGDQDVWSPPADLADALASMTIEEPAKPAPTVRPDPQGGAADACLTALEQVSAWQGNSDSEQRPAVRTGATRAWLCGDAMTAGPTDPLTQDLDALVGRYLDAPAADPDRACSAEYRLGYAVVLQYPDDSFAPIRGELHGCRTLSDGNTVREGGEEFLTTLVDAWTAARTLGSPAEVESSTCEQNASIIPARLDDIASVRLCVTGPDGVSALDPASDGNNGELARSIAASVKDAEPRSSGQVEFPDHPVRLQLIDPFNGILTLDRTSDGAFSYHVGEREYLWTPSPTVAELIDAASGSR